MVITLSSHIDGHSHAQPVAIEAQEGQDPDEPPIHLPSPTLEKQPQREKPLPVSVLQDDDTAANSVIDIGSKDGSLTTLSAWDGNPDTAHVSDGTVVAAHLGVNSQHGLSSPEAVSRLERDGPNKIDGSGKVSIGEVLLRQVSNSLTIVGSKILWRHWF